ncbi:hypothetical protein [Synechococcus elongatus]|uniref:hypothetical protein n=1 Tax=Synechococcus elongatus TaxID=32046 RepID=UPI001374FD43|nr:hypothetical protein [Synechococcus elongatus]
MAAPTPITRTAVLVNSGFCTAALLLLSQLMTLPPSPLPIAPGLPVAQRPSS